MASPVSRCSGEPVASAPCAQTGRRREHPEYGCCLSLITGIKFEGFSLFGSDALET